MELTSKQWLISIVHGCGVLIGVLDSSELAANVRRYPNLLEFSFQTVSHPFAEMIPFRRGAQKSVAHSRKPLPAPWYAALLDLDAAIPARDHTIWLVLPSGSPDQRSDLRAWSRAADERLELAEGPETESRTGEAVGEPRLSRRSSLLSTR